MLSPIFERRLRFQPWSKKPLQYTRQGILDMEGIAVMPPLSYCVSDSDFTLVTVTLDGEETTRPVSAGFIVVCGVFGEKYAMTLEKFHRVYMYPEGEHEYVIPVADARQAAEATLDMFEDQQISEFHFESPWGEDMVLKPGDYVVQDISNPGKVYRIARKEFQATYEPAE